MRRMRAQANMEGKSLYAVSSRVSLGRDLFLSGLGNFAIFAAIRRASSRDSNFVLKPFEPTAQSQSRPRRNCRLCCLDFHGVDLRHATSSAFKDIIDIKVLKSRRSSERHNSSAAWATWRPWRVFTRMFVAHGGQRSLNRKCPPKPEPGRIRSRR